MGAIDNKREIYPATKGNGMDISITQVLRDP